MMFPTLSEGLTGTAIKVSTSIGPDTKRLAQRRSTNRRLMVDSKSLLPPALTRRRTPRTLRIVDGDPNRLSCKCDDLYLWTRLRDLTADLQSVGVREAQGRAVSRQAGVVARPPEGRCRPLRFPRPRSPVPVTRVTALTMSGCRPQSSRGAVWTLQPPSTGSRTCIGAYTEPPGRGSRCGVRATRAAGYVATTHLLESVSSSSLQNLECHLTVEVPWLPEPFALPLI